MIMKQHKLFNVRLYGDMLRQLKVTGSILAAACILISLLPPLIYGFSDPMSPAVTVDINSVVPALWGFMFLGGAGLVYTAFSYLTQRSASDFYYSLPNTARATYLSVLAAVATWIVGTVTATVALTYAGYAVAGISLNLAFAPYLLGYFTIGALLVAGGATVAVCISGTKFSNLVLTILILFLPRFIMTFAGATISDLTRIIPVGEMPFFLNPAYNIAAVPMSVFFDLFSRSNMLNIQFTPGYLYSFILTAAYFTAGLALYCRRRSEVAGMNAPSRTMQHIYRCAITLPFFVILAFAALANDRNVFAFYRDNFPLAATMFLLAALVYFAYELITTKKFKNLLTTAPLFVGLAVVVPVLLWIGTSAVSDAMLNHTVEAQEIKSVRIDLSGGRSTPDYSQLLARDLEYRDGALASLVANALDRTIGDVKYRNFRYDLPSYPVKISTGLTSFTRTICFTPEEEAALQSIVSGDSGYIAAMRSLPKSGEVQRILGCGQFHVENSVWARYVEELSAYSGGEYDAAISEDPYQGEIGLRVRGARGTAAFNSFYPLNRYTPETLAAVLGQINSEYLPVLREVRDSLAAHSELTGEDKIVGENKIVVEDYIQIDFRFLNTGSDADGMRLYADNYTIINQKEEAFSDGGLTLSGLTELLDRAADTDGAAVTPETPLMAVNFQYQKYDEVNGYMGYDGQVYVPLLPGEAEKIAARYPQEADGSRELSQ